MSWQGQFGDLIESLEFYETDEKRGFVRGARWGLAPTGGPINTALPSRAGEQVWGPDHHLHVKTHLGHGANWGLFAEDLPDEANHVTLSSTVTDSSGIPAPEIHYTMADNSRRMLDFHIERATESMDAAGAYKIEVDRLMRYSGWHLLGTARMGDDPETSVLDRWNRAHDVPEPVRRRRLVLRHLVRRQPDLDDRRARAARRRPHGRDPLRAAGAGMTQETGAPTDLTAACRRRTARRARRRCRRGARHVRRHRRPPDPGRARHAVGGRGRRPTSGSGSCSRARPDLAEPLRAALRPELGDDVAARLATLGRRADQPRRAPAGDRRRLLHRQAGPRADRLSRPEGDRAPLVGATPTTSRRA